MEGILTQHILVFGSKSLPVWLIREQYLWAVLQRNGMLDCTSLNIWIQYMESGDFTTNSERRQSTEGAQASRPAVAWSICKLTNRWREYYFCFQGILLGFVFFSPAVYTSKSVLIAFFLWGHSSLQTLCIWLLADFCEQFIKEKMSNECDTVAKAVWKSAGFVQWDVCTQCILVLVCMDSCLLSYRFRQVIETLFKCPHLFWFHGETTVNSRLLYLKIKRHDSPLLSSSFMPFLTPLISVSGWFWRS